MHLHSLRLLQSVLLEDTLPMLEPSLLDAKLKARVGRLASSAQQSSLKLTAQQTLEDLQALQQVKWWKSHHK